MKYSKKKQAIILPSGKIVTLPSELELHKREFVSRENDFILILRDKKWIN